MTLTTIRDQPAGKPLPKFLSRKDTMARFHALADAYRTLGAAMLQVDGGTLSPAMRAEMLAVMAMLKGIEDGSA